MEQSLVSSAVFGVRDLSRNADFLAFQLGMSCVLPTDLSLSKVSVLLIARECIALNCFPPQIFDERGREYLAALCDFRVKSAELVISHTEIISTLDRANLAEMSALSTELDDKTWDALYEEWFENRFYAYIRGVGHPDHPDVIDVVGPEVHLRARGDTVLRARMFLHTLSGSDLVPLNSDWKLKVRILLQPPSPSPSTSSRFC